MTVSLDITKLHQQVKEKGLKFYPAFVYCVSKQIAVTKEFRMGRDKEGNPGYYDILHPNYTIFHEDDHTFSDVWTGYTEDFKTFYKNMRDDMGDLQRRKSRKGKTGTATELLLYLHGAVVKLYWLFRLHRERNPDAVSNYYLR